MSLAEDFMKQFTDNAKKEEKINKFAIELEHLINKCGIDSLANMPDYKMSNILIEKLREIIEVRGN